jgi:hypothetical protein
VQGRIEVDVEAVALDQLVGVRRRLQILGRPGPHREREVRRAAEPQGGTVRVREAGPAHVDA